MVIGSVLLQPQRFERAAQIPSDDAVLHDMISLAVRLIDDGVRGGRLGSTLGRSLEGTVTRLATRAGAGVNSAVTRFRALFAPLIAPLQAAVEQPPGEVEALIDGLEHGLTGIVNTLKSLAPEQMRQSMSAVFDILETDLGITPTFIRDIVLGVFDDMILALGSAPPLETADERAQRRAVAGLLGRIKRYIQTHFTFPAWNADAAAQALLTLRQRPDVDAALTRALCSGEAAVAYLRTGSTLLDLLPYSAFPAFGDGSVGAAAAPPGREEVSFYASKLLEYDNYDGDLGELDLASDTSLSDGLVLLDSPLYKALLPASVVLARGAFLYTVDANETWRVVDRKKYIIRRINSEELAVFRLSGREPGSEWLLDDGEFAYTITRDKDKFKVSTGDFWGWLHSTIGTITGKLKGDMVWVNRERTQVLLGQRIMHTGSNVSWYDASVFKRLKGNRHYSLQNAADTAEGWAYNASWIQDVANILINAIKIGILIEDKKGQLSRADILEIVADGLETGRFTLELIVKRAQRRPMSELVGIGFWYDLLWEGGLGIVKLIKALVKKGETSDPPATASDFSQAVSAILSVLDVEPVDTRWSELAYEFFLSLRTLINHEEPVEKAQTRPENYKENGGFVDLFWNGGLLVYTAAIPDSEYQLPNSEYALPFQTTSLTAGYWLGGALGVGLVMGFVGLLVGQGAIAQVHVFADAGHVVKTLGKSTGKSLLYFWPYLRLVKGKPD